nr:hypothetical protein [Calditrichia bacterium]
MLYSAEQRRLWIGIGISLLFHILVLLLIFLANSLGFLKDWFQDAAVPERQPIVMELQPPPPKPKPQPQPVPQQPQPQPQLPDQVPFVENENADEQKPEFGLLADKNSRSAAPEARELGTAAAPDVPVEKQQAAGEKTSDPQALADRAGQEEVQSRGAQKVFSKNVLTGSPESRVQRPASEFQKGLAQVAQPNEKPFEMGNFRLSTVNWDYVPWMEAFKGRLLFVWIAPAAYHMGLIDGYTDIRFRVSRAGELLGYEVLDHHGHPSLQESSVNAIVSVFPFRPLPDHFPDEVLEITGRLIYP